MAQYTQDEINALQDQVARQIQQNIPISADLARQMQDAAVGVKGFTAALETSMRQMGSAAKNAGIAFGSAATAAGGGAAKFNSALDDLRTVVLSFTPILAKLSPVGKAAATALAGLTGSALAGAKAANLMSDSLWKTYTELSQVGIAGAAGELHDQIKQFGYTTRDGAEGIQAYTDLLKENSESLAMMSGSAAQGAQRLATVASSIEQSDLHEKFRLLGHDLTSQNKLIAGYMRIQTMSGAAQMQTNDQLASGAAAYILQLDKLARLTGKSVDQLQKDEERRMSQARYSYKVAELEEASAKEGGKGPATEELKRMKTLAVQMAHIGPVAEQGFMDFVSGGRAASEASRQFAMTYGEAADLLETTSVDNSEAVMAATYRGGKAYVGQYRELVKIVGEQGMAGAGTDPREAQRAKFLGTMSTEERAAYVQKEQDARLAGQLSDGKGQDKFAVASVDLAQTQLAASKKLSELINQGIVPLTKAMGTAAAVLDEILEFSTKAYMSTLKVVGPGAADTPDTTRRGPKPPLREDTPAVQPAPGQPRGEGRGVPRAGAGLISGMTPEESTQILAGLNMGGKSTERTGGGEVKPQLVLLAQKIAEMYPGTTFTALNDIHHQEKEPASAHTKGTAVDFAFAPALAPADAAAAAVEVAKIKALGFGLVSDEYFANKTAKTTGPHFHAELAQGGIVSGPKSGYNAMLHGTEAVVPLPDGRTIPVEMAGFSGMISQQSDLLGMQLGRMDDLIEQMRTLNATNNKMLQYAQG